MQWRRLGVLLVLLAGLGGCSTLVRDPPGPEAHALPPVTDSGLARSVARQLSRHPGEDGVHLLDNGLDALVARLVLIEQARRGIDLQYYLYHADEVGALFTEALLRAADRGVRVRILVDDIDLGGRDEAILALDRHPNVEVRLFNPFRRGVPQVLQLALGVGRTTRRMHNKSFTVDGLATILGGRNIGNEYFAADPAVEFADLDALAIGPVVPQVSDAFDRYWNSLQAVPVTQVMGRTARAGDEVVLRRVLGEAVSSARVHLYREALRESPLAQALRSGRVQYYWGHARLVVDDPRKVAAAEHDESLLIKAQLRPLFDRLQQELLIVSPYFVPGREGLDFFRRLRARGVRVRILTNSLASNDVAIVHSGYARYRKALLRMGVELYEMNRRQPAANDGRRSLTGSSSASLHAKTFLLDRRTAFIGSLNLDPRSMYENTEIGLVVDSPDLGRDMARAFEREVRERAFRVRLVRDEGGGEHLEWKGIEDGRPVVYRHEPHSSIWLRMGVMLMRLLPVESQL